MGFDRALGLVLGFEAGLETADGYKTLAGVRQDNYDDARKGWGYPPRDVELLTVVEMRRFYCERYWEAIHGDELPPMVALVLFDSAVQHGPTTATKLLQRIVGTAVDGDFGPLTMAGVKTLLVLPNGEDKLIGDYIEARRVLYNALADDPTKKQFLAGWLSRMDRLQAELTAWEIAP